MGTSFTSNIEALLGKVENFITSKTVVGEPIHIGNVILLPLVDISFGVGAGGAENSVAADKKESGGGGMGAKITPSAVIVVSDGNVQLVHIKDNDSINKLIDMAPGILSKFNFFNKDTEDNKKEVKGKNINVDILKEEIISEENEKKEDRELEQGETPII